MIGSPGNSVRLLQVADPHLFGDEARKIYGVTTAGRCVVCWPRICTWDAAARCDPRDWRHRRRSERGRLRQLPPHAASVRPAGVLPTR